MMQKISMGEGAPASKEYCAKNKLGENALAHYNVKNGVKNKQGQ